jgi:hypothetical protein
MKHLKHALLACATMGALAACKKDDPAVVDLGYEYFPQNVGHWIEYEVDSTRVHLVFPPSTFDTTTYSYAIREVIVENITDGEGRPAQRIIRYTRDGDGNWLPKDVWWQTRDNVRAERNEENQLQVKLVFPPRTTTEWDLNAANTEEEFGLTYEEVDVPFILNGFSFDKTVTVVSTFENNNIDTRNYRARYAKNVGLVGFEMDSINAQPNFNPNNPGFDAYERWVWKYTVTAYGN